MAKSINDWLAEGESLYDNAVGEYRELEARLAELEALMAAKLTEVNKLASVIQKPALEARSKGVTVIDRPGPDRAPAGPASAVRPVARPGAVDTAPATAFPANSRSIASVIQGKGI